MGIKGYDVSDYQQAIPDDAQFVFIKVTEGRGHVQDNWRAKVGEARAQGCVVGYYHFGRSDVPPAEEFANFRREVGKELRAGELLAYDFEPYNQNVSDATATARKNEFIRLMKAAFPNHRCGMYTNVDWWKRTDDNHGDFLWIADYVAQGQPRIRARWMFHQFSEHPIDTNWYAGTAAELRAYAGGATGTTAAAGGGTVLLPVNGYLAAAGWQAGDGERVTYGKLMNVRTRRMLQAAEAVLGRRFRVTQGSFSTGVSASAGTHDGGGVLDLVPVGYDEVKALRRAGFAAWNRLKGDGFPDEHIHAVAVGDPTMSPSAKDQVDAFFRGRNALRGQGPDNFRLREADRVVTGIHPDEPPPAAPTPEEDAEMFAPYEFTPGATTIPLEPANGGAMKWGNLYFAFKVAEGDNTDKPVAGIRIELQDDAGRWSLWKGNFEQTVDSPRWVAVLPDGYAALRFYTNVRCHGYVTGKSNA
ncbi:glycoside hydrolase family 25 protein [Yinghuangia sp. YIM S09857]|uniref:glycoside hydrolase family 25 protein n=1 Tax=Yinghuangia sp. YIM S09857 TaxID=3436929 RepID=UPI003F533E16